MDTVVLRVEGMLPGFQGTTGQSRSHPLAIPPRAPESSADSDEGSSTNNVRRR